MCVVRCSSNASLPNTSWPIRFMPVPVLPRLIPYQVTFVHIFRLFLHCNLATISFMLLWNVNVNNRLCAKLELFELEEASVAHFLHCQSSNTPIRPFRCLKILARKLFCKNRKVQRKKANCNIATSDANIIQIPISSPPTRHHLLMIAPAQFPRMLQHPILRQR